MLRDENHPTTQAIDTALNAIMPWNCNVGHILMKANLIDVETDWKTQMLDIALGKEVHNQGIPINDRKHQEQASKNRRTWARKNKDHVNAYQREQNQKMATAYQYHKQQQHDQMA